MLEMDSSIVAESSTSMIVLIALFPVKRRRTLGDSVFRLTKQIAGTFTSSGKP
jgi:hypothetical protein